MGEDKDPVKVEAAERAKESIKLRRSSY